VVGRCAQNRVKMARKSLKVTRVYHKKGCARLCGIREDLFHHIAHGWLGTDLLHQQGQNLIAVKLLIVIGVGGLRSDRRPFRSGLSGARTPENCLNRHVLH
jgi:hypothetical protein